MAAMLRAFSTRSGSKGQGYDRLVDDSNTDLLGGAKLTRSRTAALASPGRFFSRSKKSTPSNFAATPEYDFPAKVWTPEPNFQAKKASTPKADAQAKYVEAQAKYAEAQAKYAAKEAKKASKIHPLFSIFERSSRRKPTAKPEFARYVQYLKEGGVWDPNSAKPVIM